MATHIASNALTVYTDGSSLPGRHGGTGFVFIGEDADGNEIREEVSPTGWAGATNNQMEIQAAIEALKIALGKHPPIDLDGLIKIQIYSDSMYLVDNFDNAKYRWSKSKWRLKDGQPVANTAQWKELLKLVRKADAMGLRVHIDWVKGHKKDKHNKRADKLAKASAKAGARRKLAPARVRRKKSGLPVEVGNIRMAGQEATIYIVTDEYLADHRCYRYLYEVMDADCGFRTPPDKIHSQVMLNAGHFYEVRMNADQGHPQVVEMYREVDEEGHPVVE